MDYKVKIAEFEGPFDLILYFIERDEINIYDIPIAKITNDFLGYIRDMAVLNIELASEFIVVAASLMRIKAKMLLPRKELDEQGEEIDPRQELVKRLIEYKKYKNIVSDLRLLEEQRKQLHHRGNVADESNYIADLRSHEMELESINLYKLMTVFRGVVDRMNQRSEEVRHEVVQFPYTIDQQKEIIKSLLAFQESIEFERIFDSCRTKIEAIYRFLAILDMVQERIIGLTLGEGANNFWLNRAVEEEAA